VTILLVDDNAQMRRLLRSLVEDFADVVCECEDGVAVLAAYQSCQPDWVLMDFKMKEIDGLSATHQLLGAFPGAKVVFLTNYDDAPMRQAARRAGACEFVSKDNLSLLRSILAPPTGTC